MYFPYLRGRQSELLAIRKLLEEGILSENVIPVIEPIKPTATLRKTLETFIEKKRELIWVSNPQVGGFKKELNETDGESEEFNKLINHSLIKKVNIVTGTEDIRSDKSGFILGNEDHLNWFMASKELDVSKILFIPDKSEFRRNLQKVRKRILHEDHFEEQNRNADYLELPSRIFSSDHRHYQSEGYYGFSDYSVVGSRFMEGGFAPRAVAIHMVYFKENRELRIRHFTSESNDNIANPAGKFYEALEKLIVFFESDTLNETFALARYRDHYANGTYPGLGVVKQLSIMHHLELMGNYLEGDII